PALREAHRILYLNDQRDMPGGGCRTQKHKHFEPHGESGSILQEVTQFFQIKQPDGKEDILLPFVEANLDASCVLWGHFRQSFWQPV
ncbi:MAG: hypothetical protein PWP42_959, partial [Candidatus Atribacteria bacterium]|nr:hypothetical protein [Candidatus Atribacteria bacterium]